MKQESTGKVGIFIPCRSDLFAPQTAHILSKLLSFLGADCHYPLSQTCCGRLLYEHGDHDSARKMGLQLVQAFADASHVVCCDMACADYLRRRLVTLLDNSPQRHAAADLSAKTFDVADYLFNVLHFSPQGRFPHRIAWLDHCALEEDDAQYSAPRMLLLSLNDITLVDVPQNYIGGGHNDLHGLLFPALTATLIEQQVQQALKAEIEYLVTAEPTAALRLQAYCRKQGLPLQCLHLVDLLCNILFETEP